MRDKVTENDNPYIVYWQDEEESKLKAERLKAYAEKKSKSKSTYSCVCFLLSSRPIQAHWC